MGERRGVGRGEKRRGEKMSGERGREKNCPWRIKGSLVVENPGRKWAKKKNYNVIFRVRNG